MDPPVYRAAGTGVFLNANLETTPLALRENLEHNHVVHACVVIISVETLRVPHVPESERVSDRRPRLPRRRHHPPHRTLRLPGHDRRPEHAAHGGRPARGRHRPRRASYFLSRITIVPTKAPGMAMWRKKLFVAIARNAANPVAYFGLPDDRTIVMASHIEL